MNNFSFLLKEIQQNQAISLINDYFQITNTECDYEYEFQQDFLIFTCQLKVNKNVYKGF